MINEIRQQLMGDDYNKKMTDFVGVMNDLRSEHKNEINEDDNLYTIVPNSMTGFVTLIVDIDTPPILGKKIQIAFDKIWGKV